MHRCSRLLFVAIPAMALALSLVAPSWAGDSAGDAAGGAAGFRGGFYVGASYGSLSNPTFRLPSGTGETSVSQSKSVPAFVAGYDIGSRYVGAGIRGCHFSADFESFATPQMPGAQEIVGYSDPKYSMLMVDMIVYWAPAASRIASVYGFLGLGSSSKKYTVSGSPFDDWNGVKSLSQFEYSYGLGARIRPVKRVSAFAEFRFIPGDQTIEGKNFLYSDGTFDYYEYGVAYTSHFTRFLAAGVAVHF
jgi:hypothetical protein